jgi:cytidine deaminase
MKQITINYQEFSTSQELSNKEQYLIQEAEIAMNKAYAPYSNFQVGCAIELLDGTIVHGSNQENSAYPSGLCAERVALFHVGAVYPGGVIKRMAISTKKEINGRPIAPCGSCRQVMIESLSRQNSPIEVLMYSGKSVLKFNNAADLMPLSFSPDDLA